MTDREKLIELMTDLYGGDPLHYGVKAYHIADHLIANGVTVQQWISVEDEKPNGWVVSDPDTDYREPETYIVFVKRATLPTTAYYLDGKFVPPCDGFLSRKNCERIGFTDEITHWMPLPEPPKEDK